MKELDFDELDRAVNSLMDGVPKAKPAKDDSEDDTKTLTISPTLQDGAVPDLNALTDQIKTSEESTPPPSLEGDSSSAQPSNLDTAVASPAVQPEVPVAPVTRSAPSLAAKRGGRFMDVVHPSSDMKTSTPARPVSRQGTTIEPAAPAKSQANEPAVQPEQELTDEPVTTKANEPVAAPASISSAAPANEWPDPLDVANFKQSKTESDTTESNTTPEEALAPLSSPFLSGTKVEKRPLGGAGGSESQKPAEEPGHAPSAPEGTQEDSISTSDPAAQLPADPGKIEAPLPEELRSDLMAIESGSHTVQEPVDSTAKADKQPEVTPSETLIEDTAKEAEPVPTGPTSISQQYKEEPNSGDQTNGAIYDTDTYHQPLAHPAKKKSGWMWVVWIILILVIGAGGGAALYFLGIV